VAILSFSIGSMNLIGPPSPKKADASSSLLFASSSQPLLPDTFEDHTSPLSPAKASLNDPKLKAKFPSSAEDAAPYLPSRSVCGELPVGSRLLLPALLEPGRCGEGGATVAAGAATGGGSKEDGCCGTGSGKDEVVEVGAGIAAAAAAEVGGAAAAEGRAGGAVAAGG